MEKNDRERGTERGKLSSWGVCVGRNILPCHKITFLIHLQWSEGGLSGSVMTIVRNAVIFIYVVLAVCEVIFVFIFLCKFSRLPGLPDTEIESGCARI